MIQPPEHPLGSAFDKARDWAADQERKLTDRQRQTYDDLKTKQTMERQQHQARLDAARTQLEEDAKKKKLKAELILKPPMRTANPHLERQAQILMAAEKRLENLDRSHTDQRLKALQSFEQERARENAKPANELTSAWKEALQKTAQQEHARDYEKTRDLTREFDKSR